jgi:hypothetical protein
MAEVQEKLTAIPLNERPGGVSGGPAFFVAYSTIPRGPIAGLMLLSFACHYMPLSSNSEKLTI